MDKILSILSLFSVIWCYILLDILAKLGYLEVNQQGMTVFILVLILILLFNIFSLRYCLKVQKEKQIAKAPVKIARLGNRLYILMVIILLFGSLLWCICMKVNSRFKGYNYGQNIEHRKFIQCDMV